MIEIDDIMKVVSCLLDGYDSNIPVYTKDLEEEFERPCFYIEWDGTSSSALGERLTEESFILRVFYFPEEKHKNNSALLSMQKDLKNLFGNVLKVAEDFVIPINEKNFTVTDAKVLVMDMTIEYWQDIEEEVGELIEELEFNL